MNKLFIGTCNIIEYQNVQDPVTKITKNVPVTIISNEPCRLSYKDIRNGNQTDTVNNITSIIKLFLDPSINVKKGSTIIVTQENKTGTYKASGNPAVYRTHQEIVLLYEGEA